MANKWEKMKTVADFFIGLQNHCWWGCSHKIKRCLLLGRKAMTNLDSILKSKHTANKDLYIQCYGFTSSHVQCESWTIKKTECQWIDIFTLWCWRRLLRISWTARGSNQSIKKEINPEAPILWPLNWRAKPLEKTLMLGNIDGRKRKEWQRMRWLDGVTNTVSLLSHVIQHPSKSYMI